MQNTLEQPYKTLTPEQEFSQVVDRNLREHEQNSTKNLFERQSREIRQHLIILKDLASKENFTLGEQVELVSIYNAFTDLEDSPFLTQAITLGLAEEIQQVIDLLRSHYTETTNFLETHYSGLEKSLITFEFVRSHIYCSTDEDGSPLDVKSMRDFQNT